MAIPVPSLRAAVWETNDVHSYGMGTTQGALSPIKRLACSFCLLIGFTLGSFLFLIIPLFFFACLSYEFADYGVSVISPCAGEGFP